jgi:serine/threonine protein kinase
VDERDVTEESADDTVVLSGMTPGIFFGDRYRVDGVLGTGAMGKVYRATDIEAGREVALKVLHPDKAAREQVLARFRREAEILTRIGHPNIVHIHDWGITDVGVDYIAMEVLEGRTLRDHLRETGPLTPRQFLPILVGVADAVAAAHVKGVVHRDLKPDNVFLQADGAPKVVDFGLSMLDTDKRMTKTGVMLGTPRYMAPEQIRSAKDVDPRVDVYALGVIAHEALAGASPFPAEDAGQLLGCVIEGRLIRIEDVRADLPPGLGDVLRRAMAKDRRERFATIGAFAEAFARVVGVPIARARQPGVVIPESAPDAPAPRAPVAIPLPPEEPRFTHPPESAPGIVAAHPAQAPPSPAARPSPSKAPLAIAFAVVAFLMLLCIGTGVLFGLRNLFV